MLLLIIGLFVVDPLLPLYTLGAGVIVSAIFAVYFIVTRLKKIEFNASNDFSKKELTSVSIPMMMTVVASFALGSIPLFMLEVFATTKEVGIFSVAFKISTVVSLSLVAVNTISAPKFSELYWSKKYNELQKVISMSTRLIFIVSLIVSMLIILFSEQILILFGNDFVSGGHVLILLVIAQMINSATGSVSILLNMTGAQRALKNIAIITTVLTIVVSYILVSNYGSIGAAYTFIISMSMINISGAIYAHMKLGYITYYNPLNFKVSN
jgi:O-antigen/teichoic acid export membrane protein